MALFLYSFQLDVGRLTRLADREKLLPPGDDLGYAIHAVFASTFGDHAPKPFAFFAPGPGGGGPSGRLLAYAPVPRETLFTHAETFADPAFSAPLDIPYAAGRCMRDEFPVGTRLGFRVRIRPVVRTGAWRVDASGAGADSPAPRKARERDAFLAHIDAIAASGTPAVPRADCYLDWLGMQLVGMGARLERGRIDAFRFTRLLMRDGAGAQRRRRYLDGPDAVAVGTLEVTDTKQFAAGLARGIGRFRTFGFGMLLLSPPRD